MLHNEKLHNFTLHQMLLGCSNQGECDGGHVPRMGQMRNEHRILI